MGYLPLFVFSYMWTGYLPSTYILSIALGITGELPATKVQSLITAKGADFENSPALLQPIGGMRHLHCTERSAAQVWLLSFPQPGKALQR